MDEKKVYQAPEAEVIHFADEDIITASDGSSRLPLGSSPISAPSIPSLPDLF